MAHLGTVCLHLVAHTSSEFACVWLPEQKAQDSSSVQAQHSAQPTSLHDSRGLVGQCHIFCCSWIGRDMLIRKMCRPPRRRRRRRRRSLLRIIHARGAIPNEMGPTRCRATPALNQGREALEARARREALEAHARREDLRHPHNTGKTRRAKISPVGVSPMAWKTHYLPSVVSRLSAWASGLSSTNRQSIEPNKTLPISCAGITPTGGGPATCIRP